MTSALPLARAVLLDATLDEDVAGYLAAAFAVEVICKLPAQGWSLTKEGIHSWIMCWTVVSLHYTSNRIGRLEDGRNVK